MHRNRLSFYCDDQQLRRGTHLQEWIGSVADETGYSPEAVEAIARCLTASLSATLGRGQSVTLPGLGVFTAKAHLKIERMPAAAAGSTIRQLIEAQLAAGEEET